MSRRKHIVAVSGPVRSSRRPAMHERAWVPLPPTDLPRRYLQAADLMICREPCVVTTVLGSCVAVTFFSARRRLAAICHAMLPAPRTGDTRSNFRAHRWRYVSCSLDELIRDFPQATEVEVKIFGGAHLTSPTKTHGRATVGSANVELARRLLAEAGFTISADDTGGNLGRKLVFDTRSGAVHVKRLLSHSVVA